MADSGYYSINDFPGDGSQTTFEVSFAGGYISRSHISARLFRDIDGTFTDVLFDWVNAYTVRVSAPVPVGYTLRVYRKTPIEQPLVDYSDGALLSEVNLDTANKQAIFAAAEAADAFGTVPGNDALRDATAALVFARSRANHTGTQEISTISGLVAALANTASKIALAASGGSGLIGMIQAGVGAVLRTVQDKLSESVSVYDYGAKGDGVTDDSAAIQRALAAKEAMGGGEVRLPRGTFKITTSIKLTGSTSLVGEGPCSVLRPNLCHGIEVLASDGIGPRRIANFWIYGNGGESFSGIYCNQTSEGPGPNRATGLVVENMYISFFGRGISGNGYWHTIFRSITMNQVWKGIYLPGRSVKVTIDDVRITKGTLVNEDGTPGSESAGFHIGSDAAGNRPEDIQITNSIAFAFSMGVFWRSCLYGGVTNCDLDYCTKAGLFLVTADGGFVFTDNWIQVDNANSDVAGIWCPARGYTSNLTNIVIGNNRVNADTVKTVAGEEHSWGVLIADKQADIVLRDNSITGNFKRGIFANNCTRVAIRDNKVAQDLFLIGTQNSTIDGNYVAGGITLSGNTNVNIGHNTGLHSTRIAATITVPANAVDFTVTYVSLNIPDLPLAVGGYEMTCVATSRGTESNGTIRLSPTRSAIAVKTGTSLAVASSIDVLITLH